MKVLVLGQTQAIGGPIRSTVLGKSFAWQRHHVRISGKYPNNERLRTDHVFLSLYEVDGVETGKTRMFDGKGSEVEALFSKQ